MNRSMIRIAVFLTLLAATACGFMRPSFQQAAGTDSQIAIVKGYGGFLSSSDIWVESVNGKEYQWAKMLRLAPGEYVLGLRQQHKDYGSQKTLTISNQYLRFKAQKGHTYQIGANMKDYRKCAFLFDATAKQVVAETRSNCRVRGKKIIR